MSKAQITGRTEIIKTRHSLDIWSNVAWDCHFKILTHSTYKGVLIWLNRKTPELKLVLS
jgi:hypothetical protein